MTDSNADAGIHDAVAETADRIATMEIRGAATIADAAAEALQTQAQESDAETPAEFAALTRLTAEVGVDA